MARASEVALEFVAEGPERTWEENRIRGIAVIKADSADEAQRIASGDPRLQGGHLAVGTADDA